MNKIILVLCTICTFLSCESDTLPEEFSVDETVEINDFTTIPSETSNISFKNKITISQVKSPMQYINVFNSGGVAVADFNNDGLDDIFFTGNMVGNKMYLNKGDFNFEDITKNAGVAYEDSWCTGITVGDVNQDGYLDLYVGRSYYEEDKKRENLLLINNGDLTFTNKAKEYGIDLRDMELLNIQGNKFIIAGNNNEKVQVLKIN